MTDISQQDSAPYVKLFRLLTAAKQQAQALGLHDLTHFTNMALLQVVFDWENLDPAALNDVELERLLQEKEAETSKADWVHVRLFHNH